METLRTRIKQAENERENTINERQVSDRKGKQMTSAAATATTVHCNNNSQLT